MGKASFNHILSQTVAPADTPNDTNWMALELGATYALSDKIDLKVSGLTWAGNDKFNYSRISAGMNYRF
ncbi:autotransporter outer membrane beta-barrel domain-containing protein [Rhizobium sp. AQ_MP]|uniref:autotransporter outer membrane beta-barrel domain-containing protein n=1 Tax=Rhizobium sp. AQ_MP TaxID=2761536 RepID=UPI00163B441E|nr:autotransporter outer membrane beta-barrel domain-containing protein [Rhizobium sp. AQ_MP]